MISGVLLLLPKKHLVPNYEKLDRQINAIVRSKDQKLDQSIYQELNPSYSIGLLYFTIKALYKSGYTSGEVEWWRTLMVECVTVFLTI